MVTKPMKNALITSGIVLIFAAILIATTVVGFATL